MLCKSCGFENPDDMNFCGKCGSPLIHICPHCGFENPPDFTFCGKCSTPLLEQSSESKSIQKDKQEDEGRAEAERRQLTVMFCDLVGSTVLSEKLDPEELREVIQNYQEVCAEVITRYDGHIAKYLGDGILVYFGYPMAHEDDARRAVHAGLEIIEKIKILNLRLKTDIDVSLTVRLGVHTGLVVVGEMGVGDAREKMAIVGETPNIAARLQEISETNSVLVSSITHSLIRGFFNCDGKGSHMLKGISQPMGVYQVIQEMDVQSQLDIAITKGLTPLVGREQEVQFLLDRWELVKEGMGQVVLLSGEAGIGKSRLLQVLKANLVGELHTKIENRCSPYYQNSSLYPLIDHLQKLLEFKKEDSSEEKLDKLERALKQYGFSPHEVAPLFASLLSIPPKDRFSPLTLTPQKQKQKTMEALLAWLMKEAEKQPVLRIVEDLQWIDPSTIEYLGLLVEQVPIAPIFTIFTYRPDFSPPWAMRSHMSQITLSRLAKKEAEVMIKRVAGGKTVPEEVVEQVITKTDGVPLFVEELTKMVLESGLVRDNDESYELTGSILTLAIPTTLQDSLMARLDRMGNVKEVAQLGATLGREFTYELMRAVSPLEEEVLKRELDKLVDAELLYQRGLPPTASYFFKHALIQEAAYESLLRSKRQKYHTQIAEVVEKQLPETTQLQPELLAHHFTEAGQVDQAIPYWHKAGQRAKHRSANEEAINHLKKSLELLETIPTFPERKQQELDMLIALGTALTAIKGYAASEVEKVYARAMELCKIVEKTPQLFPVLWGQWAFYAARADHNTVSDLAEQLFQLAQDKQDSNLLLVAHGSLGSSLFWVGKFIPALDHLDRGFSFYDNIKHRSSAFTYGQDPGIFCLSYAARALWYLGYPDQSFVKINEALTQAKELSHPFSQAFVLYCAAAIYQLRREVQQVQKLTEELIALSSENGFSQWLPYGTILQGFLFSEQQQGEKGLEHIRQGLADWSAVGSEISLPHHLGLLAETYLKEKRVEDGLNSIAEALTIVDKNGERYYEAELYRLKGELLIELNGKDKSDPEKCFLKSINIARKQKAKSLELRAVTSYCRLLQTQGKKEEARQRLTKIYSWFTEGFETKDLRDAKNLLEELS